MPNDLSKQQHRPPRDHALDGMRGVAVVLMIGFHFVYDLAFFGFVQVDFFSATMLFWRYTIVLLFLISVGVSMVISYQKISFIQYSRRLAKLLLAAMAITVGTYIVFPDNAVLFGILHLIWLASLLGYFFIQRPHWALFIAAVILILNGLLIMNPATVFHDIVYQWQEAYFPAHRGVDYYPPIPWVAWVLVGIFVGYHRHFYQRVFTVRWPWLLWIGRHALMVYFVHQMVLFSLVYGAFWLFGVS